MLKLDTATSITITTKLSVPPLAFDHAAIHLDVNPTAQTVYAFVPKVGVLRIMGEFTPEPFKSDPSPDDIKAALIARIPGLIES